MCLGKVGGTQCAEGIISMTVMHQSIILAAPMPLHPPLPQTLVLLSWMANSWGRGKLNCHIPRHMPKCYAIGVKNPSWPLYLPVYNRVQLLDGVA